MSKSLLTASRINSFLACPRKHFWSYEIGLRRTSTGLALRIGSAWHNAMEARWNGADYDAALKAALPDGIDLDEVTAHTVAALLLGYYARWGATDDMVSQLYPEIEFNVPISGSRSFVAAGKIDGLAQLADGRIAIIEHKTCGEDISDGADYWTRLRFNNQILQYVAAARNVGWPVETVVYDVTRKPSIAPKQVPMLDDHGRKVVLDASGNRVMKANGEPRESGDSAKGYTLQSRTETAEEFGQRLAEDTQTRPEFYFARREVPVLDQDIEEFRQQRLVLSRMVLSCRMQERKTQRREQAWPRNLSQMTCAHCDYSQFCLQNITPDLSHPPEGFRVGALHPELNQNNEANQ